MSLSAPAVQSCVASALAPIRVVMVNTTLPANIGSALRAMKTMGLVHLVLVAPKHYPHADIDALAAGAQDLVERIVVVDTLEQAIADCHVVLGTSARSRSIPWPLLEARPAAEMVMQAANHGQQIAVLFGREDRGLTNEELALANYHVTIPVNEAYGVLNVAQAIQIICYELRMTALAHQQIIPTTANATAQTTPQMPLIAQRMDWDEPLATQQQMQEFYPHLQQMLAEIDFLDPNNPRLLPLRLRRMFGRIQLDRMEYHLLRGIFSRVQALAKGKWQPQKNQED